MSSFDVWFNYNYNITIALLSHYLSIANKIVIKMLMKLLLSVVADVRYDVVAFALFVDDGWVRQKYIGIALLITISLN